MRSGDLHTYGLAGLLLALATLTVIGDLSLRTSQGLQQASREADGVHRVLSLNQNVLNTLRDAESEQRGYLLTGREDYLEPYQKAVRHLPEEMTQLIAALGGETDQLRRASRRPEMPPASLLQWAPPRIEISLRHRIGFGARAEPAATRELTAISLLNSAHGSFRRPPVEQRECELTPFGTNCGPVPYNSLEAAECPPVFSSAWIRNRMPERRWSARFSRPG